MVNKGNKDPSMYSVVGDEEDSSVPVSHVRLDANVDPIIFVEGVNSEESMFVRKKHLVLIALGCFGIGALFATIVTLHHERHPIIAPLPLPLPLVANATVEAQLPPSSLEDPPLPPPVPPYHGQNKSKDDQHKQHSSDSSPSHPITSWFNKALDTVTSLFAKHLETKLEGGGRDWLVNAETGVVLSKHDPSFRLGRSASPLILVPRASSNALNFDENFTLFQTNKATQLNVGIAHSSKTFQQFHFYDTVVADYIDPILIEYRESNFIVFDNDFVLDIALWDVKEDQHVNFLKATDNSTFTQGGGRDFVFNTHDGTISPKLNPSLVLGFGQPNLIITQKEEATLQFLHAQQLADGEAAAMETKEVSVSALDEKKSDEGWRYRESIITAHSPIQIHFDGNFLLTADERLVVDVSYWKMEEGNTVNFVGGDDEEDSSSEDP